MINVSNLIASAFQVASSTFGLVKAATYTQTATSSYDPSGGVVSKTPATAATNVIFGEFEEKNPTTDYREGDKRIMIQAAELASLGAVSVDDSITDTDGKKWKFLSISLDPTGSIYIVHGRTNAQ